MGLFDSDDDDSKDGDSGSDMMMMLFLFMMMNQMGNFGQPQSAPPNYYITIAGGNKDAPPPDPGNFDPTADPGNYPGKSDRDYQERWDDGGYLYEDARPSKPPSDNDKWWATVDPIEAGPAGYWPDKDLW